MTNNKSARRFSLQIRLIGMSAASLLLTSAIGFLSLSEMKAIAGRTSEIADVWVPGIQGLARIRTRVLMFRMTDYQLLNTEKVEEKNKLLDDLDSLNNDMVIYNSSFSDLIADDKSQKEFDEYKNVWTKYSEMNADFVKKIKANQLAEAKLILKTDGEKIYEEMLSQLTDLDVINSDGSVASRDAASQRLKYSKLIIWISIPSIFALALLLIGYYNRRISKSLAHLAVRLKDSAGIVMVRGDSLSDMAAQLSQSTESSASAIEQTAVTTKHINQSVLEGKNLADEALGAINSTKESAKSGNIAIRAVDEAMTTINQSNNEILGHAQQNHEDMRQVTSIINTIREKTKIINDIVFQTKLLSFNASVEAARAAHHGKGFAVVADEIAKLAQVSGSAAQEIQQILESSSVTVDTIVEDTKVRISNSVKQSSSNIQVGVERIASCTNALNEIVMNAEKASQLADVIVSASARQSQGTSEINSAIELLSQSTAKNSSLATGTAKESNEMKEQPDILSEIVSLLEYEVHGSARPAIQDSSSTKSAA